MSGGGGALHLSLLSRGVGEVTKNGHEKIDVVLEPQDYLNFGDNPKEIYLPPIQPHFAYDSVPTFSQSHHFPRHHGDKLIPKTFTTRKGALLLFSEDLAMKHRNGGRKVRRNKHHRSVEEKTPSETDMLESDLKTVDDLAKSILFYGSQDERGSITFLGQKKRDTFDRQMRPGFSAKRYLSSWSKSWDYAVLEKVINKGYLTEKTLFYYNPLMPNHQRRLHDDMSHFPAPYKLMRNMLLSPGSLAGYTFYRVRPESSDTFFSQDIEEEGKETTSIKVINTKDGVPREVTYSSLDRTAKEDVLTDLLVKSAVHYAMIKQKEYLEDAAKRQDTIQEEDDMLGSLPKFNMKSAVDSLLDAPKASRPFLEPEFVDDKSSEHSSFRGRARKGKSKKSSRSSESGREDREYVGSLPIVSIREDNSSQVTSLPAIPGALTHAGQHKEHVREPNPPLVLPPISRQESANLSTTGEDEEEEEATPEVNILPPTPQHTSLNIPARDLALTLSEQIDEEQEGSTWPAQEQVDGQQNLNESLNRGKNKGGSLVHSSSESVGGGSVHSVPLAKPARTQWKGSTQSLKSVGSRKDKVPTGSGEESQRGSVVMGPDGQVINVGGSIGATPRDTGMIQEVNDANRHADEDETDNDEPEEWKYSRVIRRSHSKREVDLTSGDIDATLSIHSWSYNQTPALDEDYPGLKKSESSRSLPNLPFKDTELFPSILKDLTILSKATEKTEEYLDPHTLGEEKMTTVTSLESLPSSGPPKTTADLETLQENESEPQETVVTVPSGQESPHHDNNDDDARSREISQDSVNDALGFVSKVSFHKGQRSSSRESIPDIPEDRALRRGSSVGSLEKSEETAPNHSRDITPPAVPSRRGSILMSRRASRMSIVESVREEEANEGSEGDQTIPERPHTARGSVKSHGTAPSPASLHSQLSEKEVIDILTDHAAKIASEVLNNSGQGQDLRQDARTAAEIWQDWTDKHPTQSQALSRSHSVQGGDKDVLEVYIQKGKRGSAGPILPQADDDLFQKLAAAADSPDGLSPEMLQQLKEQGLTPDDVEVCEDEAGQKYVRTKSEMSRMMGGVKEGHIFGQKTGVPSIPGDRQSQADIGELDIIKYAAPPTDLDSASQASGSHKSSKRSDGGQGSGKGAGSSVKGSSVKGLSEKAVSEKGRSQPPSVTGESVTEEKEEGPEGEGPERKSLVSFRDETDEAEDEFKQAVDQVEERRSKAGDSEDQKSVVSKATEERSIKSGKSSDGGKSKVSEPSEKKRASPEKKEEFVVGKVKQSKELEQLYGPIEPAGKDNSGLTTTTDAPPPDNSKTIETKPEPPSQPPGRGLGPVAPPSKPREDKPKYVAPPTDVDTLTPIPEDGKVDYKGELQKLFGGKLPEKKKEEPKGKPKGKKPGKTKGKKGGKKTTKKEEPTPKAPPPKTESPPPAKEATPPPPQPEPEAEKKSETETDRESIAESYKTEESLDFQIIRDEFSPEPEEPSQQQHTASIHSEPSADEHTETENEDEDDEAARLRMISNREARAAKRAAQAEKRRQEVEKRRREREEQVRREKEEFERQQQLKQELEEERKRNEEKRRLRREQQMEEEERENAEMAERLRQEQLEQERERRRKEEYQKKLDEMKRKHLEEEEKRHQAMLEKQREEEERQREIEAMLAKKSEEERREWERQRALEEAERLRKEEEERIKREEEAKRAMEEARRLAEEMAKKQAELEARLKFNRTVQVEGQQLDHSHSITPAFVFSYYELLSWLGLEPQDFDLMKLSQY